MKSPVRGATVAKNTEGKTLIGQRSPPSTPLRVVRGTVTQKTNKPGGAKPLGR